MSLVGKPGYKETAVGWIPVEWACEKLSGLTRSFAGGTPDRSNPEYFNGAIPWVKSGEVNSRKITSTDEHISESALAASSAKLVERGAVLVAMYGATAGKVARLHVDAATNQAVLSIRAARSSLDIGYLFWVLESNAEKLLAMCQGAAQPNLSKGLIDGLPIGCPSLPEQKKIAAILTAVDDKLDVIDRQISATQTLKQGLMQTLFTRGAGTPDTQGHWHPHTEFQDTELGRIPVGWSVLPIGDALEVVERPFAMEAKSRYRRVTVKRRHGGVELRDELPGDEIKVKNQYLLEAGDFLISERQIVHGACGIVPIELAGALVSNEYLVLKARANFDVRYFNYLVQLLRYAKLFLVCSQGVDIEKFLFKPKDWLKKLIPVPPLVEQQKMVNALSALEEKEVALTTQQSHYQSLKRGLMQKLLTGAWRVQVDVE